MLFWNVFVGRDPQDCNSRILARSESGFCSSNGDDREIARGDHLYHLTNIFVCYWLCVIVVILPQLCIMYRHFI